ncbi:hypothetical protein BGX34_004041 [Mortierella sp. NVP85]|nr:hypothetical protein BGX34_004041 [Mortierella sp. NVP85]
MSKPTNSTPRWFFNSRVQEFYACAKLKSSVSGSEAAGKSGSKQGATNIASTTEATTVVAGELKVSSTTMGDSTHKSLDADQHEKVQTKQPSASNVDRSKPIPRKLFKVIKKKLQKRERRKLTAIGVKKERVFCNTSMGHILRLEGTDRIAFSRGRSKRHYQ